MGWLVQNLFSSLAWEVLLMVGGGALLGYLRKKIPENASSIGYGIFGATCVAVLLYTTTGRGILTKKPPEAITQENVEENIKMWADHLAIGLERQNPSSEEFFAYLGRGNHGDPVRISRAKDKPGYLQLVATISTSPEHQAIIAKLSRQDYGKFLNELGLEISRLKRMSAGLGFSPSQRGYPIGPITVVFQSGVPIPELSEGYFSERFDEITSAIAEVRAVINVALNTPPVPPKYPASR
jgi:hypothetical protein